MAAAASRWTELPRDVAVVVQLRGLLCFLLCKACGKLMWGKYRLTALKPLPYIQGLSGSVSVLMTLPVCIRGSITLPCV